MLWGVDEFKQMVDSVRIVEQTLGKVTYGGVEKESSSKKFRKSLFVVEDIAKGEKLTNKNIRPIRPANGMHTKYYYDVLGETALNDIKRGTPLHINLITCSKENLQTALEIEGEVQMSVKFYEKMEQDMIQMELKEAKAKAAAFQQLVDKSNHH